MLMVEKYIRKVDQGDANLCDRNDPAITNYDSVWHIIQTTFALCNFNGLLWYFGNKMYQ